MIPPRLSLTVIVRNEIRNIDRCLGSVAGLADQIVIVDSGSTDGTPERCRAYTDQVFFREFDDYASQKNHALDKASGEWALSLDADEELTPELKEEIRRALEKPSHAAYRIRRRSRIFGRTMRFTGTQDDRPVRLFRKTGARFRGSIHETLETAGSVGELKHPMMHHTYPSYGDYFGRLNRYTSMEAEAFLKEGRQTSPFDMTLKPFAVFFRLYFLRFGFCDGAAGFAFSALSGYYAFVKHAKQREAQALGALHAS